MPTMQIMSGHVSREHCGITNSCATCACVATCRYHAKNDTAKHAYIHAHTIIDINCFPIFQVGPFSAEVESGFHQDQEKLAGAAA